MEVWIGTSTSWLAAAGEHGGKEHHGPGFWGLVFYIGLVLAILFGLMSFAKTGLKSRVFTKPTLFGLPVLGAFEQIYLFIEQLCVGTIGAHGRKYVVMIMVFWMLVFFSNLVALFFPTAPTADLSFNLGLALVSIGYVQWEGIKANGLFGHFRHFAGPKLGGMLILISLIIFVIEIISELMKNVSLSLRLYGNIDGGHRAADAMNELGKNIIPLGGDTGLSIPIGAFLMPIKLLTCVVQAMIFCLLTCVYLSLVTHHEDEHHEEGHGQPVPAGAH
ncbi:MAG: F0F1 ATP synthase subunit A [Fimbriimonadaceae bacterium]|nr:F0F1 ATP synthase subunit A [Fimbriimonadaceae bacterium]QYK57316.1 MAG: F0F1 ATP synthase subunit A [Fimbriimonadaceae bacterium]